MKMRYVFLCLLLASPASADEVVFYRCTDTAGALTLQNMPCPKGNKQEKKVMQSVSTVPMGTPSAPAPARPAQAPAPAAPTNAAPANAPQTLDTQSPAAPDAAPASTDAVRLPPPVLFQCTTHDKDSYVTEDGEPQSRCVALRTVGLDGNPQTGAGEACEVIRDTCARVADGALCDAWKKRLGETEVAWRFAKPENAQKNQAEFERVQRIVGESACSLPPKP
ncbi:MAG TPA: DUF4124 domain-containing protein [Pseudoxanthomonas sp.]